MKVLFCWRYQSPVYRPTLRTLPGPRIIPPPCEQVLDALPDGAVSPDPQEQLVFAPEAAQWLHVELYRTLQHRELVGHAAVDLHALPKSQPHALTVDLHTHAAASGLWETPGPGCTPRLQLALTARHFGAVAPPPRQLPPRGGECPGHVVVQVLHAVQEDPELSGHGAVFGRGHVHVEVVLEGVAGTRPWNSCSTMPSAAVCPFPVPLAPFPFPPPPPLCSQGGPQGFA